MSIATDLKKSFLPRQRGSAENKPKDVAHKWPSPVRPSVMLVPRHVRAKRDQKVMVRKTVATAVVAAAGVVIIAGGIGAYAGVVKVQLNTAQQDGRQLQAQVRTLAPVGQYYDDYEAQQQAVAGVVSKDVSYARVLNQITAAVPAGNRVVTETTQFGTGCFGPNPFASAPAVGCVTVEISGSAITDSTVFLNNLTAAAASPDNVLVDTYLTENTLDETGKYTATVNFTDRAFSNKFGNLVAPDGTVAADAAAPTTEGQ